jgi:hypothetical protein
MPKHQLILPPQLPINKLQFITEPYFFLHDTAKSHQDIFKLPLKENLLQFDAAAPLHLAQLNRALVNAATQCIDTGICR